MKAIHCRLNSAASVVSRIAATAVVFSCLAACAEPSNDQPAAGRSDGTDLTELASRAEAECEAAMVSMLDVPGPGQESPEEAVSLADSSSSTILVRADAEEARVATTSESGQLLKLFTLRHRDDGWWPESFVPCSRASKP